MPSHQEGLRVARKWKSLIESECSSQDIEALLQDARQYRNTGSGWHEMAARIGLWAYLMGHEDGLTMTGFKRGEDPGSGQAGP